MVKVLIYPITVFCVCKCTVYTKLNILVRQINKNNRDITVIYSQKCLPCFGGNLP